MTLGQIARTANMPLSKVHRYAVSLCRAASTPRAPAVVALDRAARELSQGLGYRGYERSWLLYWVLTTCYPQVVRRLDELGVARAYDTPA
jgi:hypothetical protein